MKLQTSISFFFPAFNEEKNIGMAIKQASQELDRLVQWYEIIIIDDGSSDKTSEIVDSLAQKDRNLRLIRHTKNKGYGGALKTGISNARNEYVCFTDADLQFDLRELENFLSHIPEFEAVVGYRKNRQDSKMRILNALIWNFANRLLFGLRARDIDCAFKLFRRETISQITLHSDGAMISAEILLKLHMNGVGIKEIPVSHFPRKDGLATGANLSVIVRALKEMWHLYTFEMGKKMQIQLIKFLLVGTINTATVILIYILLTRSIPFFMSHYILTETVAYFAGTLVSFRFNRRWTFQKQLKTNFTEVLRFYGVVGSAWAINVSVMYLLVSKLHFFDIFSVFIAAITTVAWNFLLSKYWVFRSYGKF